MLAKPAASVGRQGRGMDAFEHEMARGVDEIFLPSGKTTPQHEDQMVATIAQRADSRIGEGGPSQPLMAVGLMRPHRQGSVQKQHALLGPTGQIARRRHLDTQVVPDFLVYIEKRGRQRDSFGHGEAQAHCLPRLVVGILPYDHHPHTVVGAKVESIEDQPARGITREGGILLSHRLSKLGEIRFRKLRLQMGLPTTLYLYFHSVLSL